MNSTRSWESAIPGLNITALFEKNGSTGKKDLFLQPYCRDEGQPGLVMYRAQDKNGTSRIGIANSRNGTEFRKNPVPVLAPDNDTMEDLEWEGGCEDPRGVRREDGLYVMTYTAYDGETAGLCLASSREPHQLGKHGVVPYRPQIPQPLVKIRRHRLRKRWQ